MASVDPVSEKTFTNIDVQLINQDRLDNKIADLGKNETIDVTLEDRRSVLDKINNEDITVNADLNKLSITNAIVPDVIVKNNTSSKVKKLSNDVLPVTIDDISYIEVPIDLVMKGEPPKGYSIKNIELLPPHANISGPRNIVRKINKTVCEIDQSTVKNNETVKYAPVIYDKNGDIVNNKSVKIKDINTSYKVELSANKNIPIEIKAYDDEKSAGKIKDISYTPTTVNVSGDENKLKHLAKIKINIPVKIEITDIKNKKLTKVIDVSEYLPDGITLSNDKEKINVDVTYDPYPSKDILLNNNKISIVGMNNKYSYEINSNVKVSVTAPKNILDQITSDDITAKIDVSTINTLGISSCPLNVSSSKGFVSTNIKELPVNVLLKGD